jgi:hypothetical protein
MKTALKLIQSRFVKQYDVVIKVTTQLRLIHPAGYLGHS